MHIPRDRLIPAVDHRRQRAAPLFTRRTSAREPILSPQSPPALFGDRVQDSVAFRAGHAR
eukprot:3103130-Rhodomonas_salina.1